MRFSFIIPAFNAEDHIERCVESVLDQTGRDFECVIVDDGSSDRTAELCDALAKRDPRIAVLHTPNQGVILARKAGSAVCKGDYLLCLDSDDSLERGLLEKLDGILTENPDADMVAFGYRTCIQGKTGETAVAAEVADAFDEGMYRGERIELIRDNFLYDGRTGTENDGAMTYSMCTKAIRRDLFVRCIAKVPGGIRLGEDMLFVLNVLNECRAVYVSRYCGYNYFENPRSATHNYREGDIRNGYRVLRELLNLSGGGGNRTVQAMHLMVNYFWDKYISCGCIAEDFGAFRSMIENETDRDLLAAIRDTDLPGMSGAFRFKKYLISRHALRTVRLYSVLRFRKAR